MRPRKLTRDDVVIEIVACEDNQLVRGAFDTGDDERDGEIEDEILSRLDAGDVWAWCQITVRVTWGGYRGEAYLGGCSYRDEQDFVDQGYYYPDMVDEALETLNSEIKEAYETMQVLCQ